MIFMYDNKKVEKLREYLDSLSIIDIIDEFEISLDDKFRCSCLLHEETKPSMFIDIEKNKWHCFSCQHGGSVSNLISDYFIANYNTNNYYSALNLYLKQHNEIKEELGFIDLIERTEKVSTLNLKDIEKICEKLQYKEDLTKIKLELMPSKKDGIETIINSFIKIQNSI